MLFFGGPPGGKFFTFSRAVPFQRQKPKKDKGGKIS